jgi:hypothetical protein
LRRSGSACNCRRPGPEINTFWWEKADVSWGPGNGSPPDPFPYRSPAPDEEIDAFLSIAAAVFR